MVNSENKFASIMQIPWVHGITNNAILIFMNERKELLLAVKEGKIRYLGHILRGECYCDSKADPRKRVSVDV